MSLQQDEEVEELLRDLVACLVAATPSLPDISVMSEPPIDYVSDSGTLRGGRRLPVASLLLLFLTLLGLSYVLTRASGTSGSVDPTAGTSLANEPPVALVAAETYAVSPGADTLRALFDSIGGFDGVVLGVAEGAFDLLSFDPTRVDRVIASRRSSYGAAENQEFNETWHVEADDVAQTLWRPDTAHDYAYYNADGSITMWIRSADTLDLSPRVAIVIDTDGSAVSTSVRPMHVARTVTADRTVFALTTARGSTRHVDLIADDGATQRRLDSGEPYEWIDAPMPGVLVAYPTDRSGVTRVWDTRSLDPLPDHVLSGLAVQRMAVSGNAKMAVGINFDNAMEVIDLVTGTMTRRFGSVDPRGMSRPVALNEDGTVAITVDRDGTVSIWFVDDGMLVASLAGGRSAATRWLPDALASRISSTAVGDGSRVAVFVPAVAQTSVSWRILDTDVNSWLERACLLAGRSLTSVERSELDLPADRRTC